MVEDIEIERAIERLSNMVTGISTPVFPVCKQVGIEARGLLERLLQERQRANRLQLASTALEQTRREIDVGIISHDEAERRFSGRLPDGPFELPPGSRQRPTPGPGYQPDGETPHDPPKKR